MATERKDHKTPQGGAYSVITYMDIDKWIEVEKADATGCTIAEYDADDKMIFETVARFGDTPTA